MKRIIVLLAAVGVTCSPAAPAPNPSALQTTAAFDMSRDATATAQASADQTAAAPTPTPNDLRIARTVKPTPFGAINWDRAHNYGSQSKTVCGPVVGENAPKDTPGNPTFIEVGARAPDPNHFIVLIYGDHRAAFPQPLESYYLGKNVCATGTITLNQGVAEMELSAPAQLSAQ